MRGVVRGRIMTARMSTALCATVRARSPLDDARNASRWRAALRRALIALSHTQTRRRGVRRGAGRGQHRARARVPTPDANRSVARAGRRRPMDGSRRLVLQSVMESRNICARTVVAHAPCCGRPVGMQGRSRVGRLLRMAWCHLWFPRGQWLSWSVRCGGLCVHVARGVCNRTSTE